MRNKSIVNNSKPIYKKAVLPNKEKLNLATLTEWVIEKDKRTTIVWIGASFGSLLIAIYYLILGFTPTINLGQAPLLLLQAFFVGILLTLYFSSLIFAPTWAYSVLGIEIHTFSEAHRKSVISALARRNFTAQIFFSSILFLMLFPSPFSAKEFDSIYWVIACQLAFFTCLFLIFMPRLSNYGKLETSLSYIWTIIVLGFFGLTGTVLLIFLYGFAPKENKPDEWLFWLTWTMVIAVSAAISTAENKYWGMKILIPFFIFILLLYVFNLSSLPFKGTAAALGIAEARPVTLVLPPTTCNQIKLALNDPTQLDCVGPNAGILRDVDLLNTLGERWVIRHGKDENRIIFEGKGTVIKRSPPQKTSNKN